jgi:protocatechuate 3,4-dioxygenase beta subunit
MGTGFSRRDMILTGTAAVAIGACTGKDAEAKGGAGKARANLYQCEGCEGALERDAAAMSWSVRIDRDGEPGEKLLIEGRVLQADGQAPAAGVVVYAYHTNAAGVYGNGSSESEWSKRHGRLRAWVKTDADGRYRFETIKPAPYPGRDVPAHVHFTILEPGRRPYYVDDIVFAGEFGVTEAYRRQQELRGGSGIVTLARDAQGRWLATRDIVLERHP